MLYLKTENNKVKTWSKKVLEKANKPKLFFFVFVFAKIGSVALVYQQVK